ncbi:sensor histidine kinase [Jongsikchunia kroppenstedtii]|uniref:sensor histidine kinase n=1 Tax=Jongsikchunia kroppenstedtii TaxID=1121721 RepID=UPI000367D430|nr:ATP-binding protein [Jongsikchunia kroppenstedtii]
MTAGIVVAAVLVALVCGGCVGWLLARRWRGREVPLDLSGLAEDAVSARRAIEADEVDEERMSVATLLNLVVRSSENGIAVVDALRDVVMFNPRAADLGIVHGRLLDDRAWEFANQALRTGVDVSFDLSAPAPSAGLVATGRLVAQPGIATRCLARVVSGGDNERYVVIYAQDDTENLRVEATRRDFVANVSHELKTPVGAIGLLTEALLESVDDPESVRHFGKRVLTESNRMGNMVNELIALSRLQGAEGLPDLEDVDVDELVAEAIARAQVAAEAAEITLATDDPSGLMVRGDRTLLLTALNNLITNAIAYSPPRTQVSVSRRVVRSVTGPMVAIAVTDRGIGIAPSHQARVFERFFRVDKARSRMTGGTGLGLAIVKHVAANHNGAINLWSRPGTGSTFTLTIPQAPGTHSPSVEPADAAGPSVAPAATEDPQSSKDLGAAPALSE